MSGLSIERGFAPVRGGTLAFEVAGEGSPVVLTHAGIADRGMWDGIFESLAAHHRVIRYDIRGFGESSPPTGEVAYHDDLRELLQRADTDSAHVVGISFGGRISLTFALAYPELARSLTLVAAGTGNDDPPQSMRDVWQAVEEAEGRGDLALANELELRMWVDGLGQPASRVAPAVREKVRAMNMALFEADKTEFTAVSLEPPPHARLAEVSAPTLVMVGDLDVPTCIAAAARFEREIPGARRSAFEGCAHMLPMEQPDRFVRELLAFFAGVDGSQRV